MHSIIHNAVYMHPSKLPQILSTPRSQLLEMLG
jgi:hypothetical protein